MTKDNKEKPLILTKDMEVKNVVINNWALLLGLSNGKVKTLAELPDYIANPIDEYLTELERGGEFNGTTSKDKK